MRWRLALALGLELLLRLRQVQVVAQHRLHWGFVRFLASVAGMVLPRRRKRLCVMEHRLRWLCLFANTLESLALLRARELGLALRQLLVWDLVRGRGQVRPWLSRCWQLRGLARVLKQRSVSLIQRRLICLEQIELLCGRQQALMV